MAAGDLGPIPIGNVTWTASGAGFQAGTMSSTVPVTAGSWNGPGTHNGGFSYSLVNSWTYPVGNYSVSSTYTLTAP
jgi:hypothetical protein